MTVLWTPESRQDLIRIDAYLAVVDVRVALQVVDDIFAAAQRLRQYPELGARVDRFPDRNVRRLLVGDYELRYERFGDVIHILRAWHVREDR